MVLHELADSLRGPVVDLDRTTLRDAVEKGVEEMSDGRLAAIPLGERGMSVSDNHPRYALQADGILIGEIIVDKTLTSGKLYAGVQGVLKEKGYAVAITTPHPQSRRY